MNKLRFAIFASGAGSNANNLIRLIQQHPTLASIGALVCDNPKANVISIAKELSVPVLLVDYGLGKVEAENEILNTLKELKIDWVLLAGYMRILSPKFVETINADGKSRIVNIHPSLLPKYRGSQALEKSYESDDKLLGATLHFVDEGVDTGKIIQQKSIYRKDTTNFDDAKTKIHKIEHELYTDFVTQLILQSREELCLPYV